MSAIKCLPWQYFLPWNAIYPGIVAMLAGGVSCVLCRPDLIKNTLIGGALFTVFYLIFLIILEIMAPGYIARVWNLPALSGVMLGAFPVEELLFGFGIGTYWSGVYEHITWQRSS